jgi:hypothetical protein
MENCSSQRMEIPHLDLDFLYTGVDIKVTTNSTKNSK